MPFDNNTSGKLFEFDGQLILLTEIINTYSSYFNVINAGDFNADPFCGKRFDNRFKFFLNRLCTQNTGYSYYNNEYTAHIDHILTKFYENKQLFYNFQCNILNSEYNLSDHFSLSFVVEMIGESKIQTIKVYPDLIDLNTNEQFSKLFEEYYLEDSPQDDNLRNNVDFIYQRIVKNIKLAYDNLTVEKPIKISDNNECKW